jgi:organic hydroperoxide reductase OsmC/OhrA
LLSASQRPDIVVGSPPEWGGTLGNWAPEELLIGAVNSCIMLTFLTLAKARGADLVGYESDVDGGLEKVSGVYQMTKITIRPHVVVASEEQRAAALRAMDHVEAHCFMSQSVKATVALDPRDHCRDCTAMRPQAAVTLALLHLIQPGPLWRVDRRRPSFVTVCLPCYRGAMCGCPQRPRPRCIWPLTLGRPLSR